MALSRFGLLSVYAAAAARPPTNGIRKYDPPTTTSYPPAVEVGADATQQHARWVRGRVAN